MKLQFQMNLEQTQKLVMTPELRQAIEILQYNALELHQHIETEMLENPVLEMADKQTLISEQAAEKPAEIDWKKVAHEYGASAPYYSIRPVEDDEDYSLESTVASEETLHDHLLFQLQFTLLPPKLLTLGRYLIQNIANSGYLAIDKPYTLRRFKVDEDQLEEVIQTIQTFDPYGVAARDIQECLAIQVQMKHIEDPVVIAIIDRHIDDLAANHIKEIAKELNVPIKRVQQACDIIKRLDPKPGLKYSSSRDTRYITPDVELKLIDGKYTILVNDSSAPKLLISNYYQRLLKQEQLDQATFDYIGERLNRALKLIKSIEQRRSTIYNVVQSILEQQHDFFERGTMHLKVLNLKDVASAIDVHESTVSRAISGKFLQCPQGVYELKFFFQSGVTSNYGDGVSAESIKAIIRDMIAEEDRKKPISDQHIANQINAVGVKISRRTVAKYREAIGILGSSKRKRYG